ncbi:MAG: hypothetical protein ACYSU5_25470, partial [Planctomycetota bacterium]
MCNQFIIFRFFLKLPIFLFSPVLRAGLPLCLAVECAKSVFAHAEINQSSLIINHLYGLPIRNPARIILSTT